MIDRLAEELKGCLKSALFTQFALDYPLKDLQVLDTRKEFEGDYTWIIFPFVHYSKAPVEETARALGEILLSFPLIRSYQVVKGFLNISLDQAPLLEAYGRALASPNFGQLAWRGEKVMIEFSSPNTNKPLHLGHVRNNLLGHSLAAILTAAGYTVMRACLVNDRGIHICKSMLAYQIWGRGETPESSGIKGDHLVGNYYVLFDQELKKEIEHLLQQGIPAASVREHSVLLQKAQAMLMDWEDEVPAVRSLWNTMNSWVYEGFRLTYQRLGIHFDRFYYESQTYLLGKTLIEEGLEMGVFFTKPDGSVWIDLTEEGLDQKLVLRADGTSVYMTQDLGTAQLKYEDFHMSRSIFVVGNEQDYHFKVLFSILKRLGKPYAQGLFHLSYGMVDLPSGKMKSREGTVVDADELMDQMLKTSQEQAEQLGKTEEFSPVLKQELYQKIGLGALKYYLLKVDPQKRMVFNPEESIDLQGNTGPFIQYSYARIQSILRKVPLGLSNDATHQTMAEHPSNLTTPLASHPVLQPTIKTYAGPLNGEERALIKMLIRFEGWVEEAALQYSPALIASYSYELAKLFNHFYHLHPILKAEDMALINFRIQLCQFTGSVIQKSLYLLGIEVPEKM